MAGLYTVGHDAFPSGAQHLLLNLARTYTRQCGIEITLLLLGDGKLRADYEDCARVLLVADRKMLRTHAAELYRQGYRHAIVNTSASGWVCPLLRETGIDSVTLVHELPGLLREKNLLASAQAGAEAAARVVFPAKVVRDQFFAFCNLNPVKDHVRPQGAYAAAPFAADARDAVRRQLGVAPDALLAVGVGYADLRKGFDLFLRAWHLATKRGQSAHFCWLGDLDPAIATYFAGEIEAAHATGTLHMPGRTSGVADYLSAADVFLLTSREDPFPSVVLEAACAGTPIVAFEGTGGSPETIVTHGLGEIVPLADVEAMLDAALRLGRESHATRGSRPTAEWAAKHFDFSNYAVDLLAISEPSRVDISAVVPNYNYSSYVADRLGSIFRQTYPVREVIVLDDASIDDSVATAERVATEWRRDIRLVVNPKNSGSVFRQWRRAAECATAQYVWIAEADDQAEPEFLDYMAQVLSEDPTIVMAFTDSRTIDRDGRPLAPSYQEYYRQSGADALGGDLVMQAADFAHAFLLERNLVLNVSAVVWKRESLLAALGRCETALESYRLAGDWHLYLDLLGRSNGKVAFVARPLNVHRRHTASVTHSLEKERHIAEIARVHALSTELFGIDPDLESRQRCYRHKIAVQLGVKLDVTLTESAGHTHAGRGNPSTELKDVHTILQSDSGTPRGEAARGRRRRKRGHSGATSAPIA